MIGVYEINFFDDHVLQFLKCSRNCESTLGERKVAPNRTIQSNEEIPVFTNSDNYPVNSYWISRSLSLPPAGLFKERGRLKISAPLF